MPEKPPSHSDRVVSEIEIAVPPERVFEALVDEKQLARWWGREQSVELVRFEMDPRVRGRWRYESKARPGGEETASSRQLRKNGGTAYQAHGEILEIERPRLLVYTWIANWHADPEAVTTVRWEIERMAAGTLVRVIHSGLASEPASREEYGGGWKGVLELLARFLLGN
jgi:uncharacterized protein YndB with AHSA1/START domain